MEFRDLKKQYQVLKKEIDQAVVETMTEGHFIGGNPVDELEKELAEYVKARHCITCGNGTDALSLVLMAWNIGEGDAVFVPDFTFFATAEVVSFCGATPIFVDVEKETFNLDPEDLRKAIKEVQQAGKLIPKVIIPVDLFGLPANYPEITAIAKENNLLVLEDGAQGFGGEINGQKACSFADAATTSFFPAKPVGCYGDGGAIFTDDDDLAEKLKSLKVHGKGSYKYDNVRIGINSRLDTIQAAVLKVKFQAFKEYELEAVNKVADKYREILDKHFITPQISEGYLSSYAQFTLILDSSEQREAIQNQLKGENIPTMIYYPIPLTEQKAFAYLGNEIRQTKKTSELCQTVLSIPMHPYLTDQEIELVANTLIESKEIWIKKQ